MHVGELLQKTSRKLKEKYRKSEEKFDPHKGEVICWALHLMCLLCIKPLQKMWENIL
jgi:hypothetical protein